MFVQQGKKKLKRFRTRIVKLARYSYNRGLLVVYMPQNTAVVTACDLQKWLIGNLIVGGLCSRKDKTKLKSKKACRNAASCNLVFLLHFPFLIIDTSYTFTLDCLMAAPYSTHPFS